MAIEGFLGRPGSGKSYFLTQKALKEADRDRLVFTNWVVNHPNVYFFTPDQLLDLPPGLVMIDESHLWFPSRGSLKLPMSWLAGMSQTRKKGWDLVWASQHERRVDSVVKDVTSWMWKCSIVWSKASGTPLIFKRDCWEPENFRNPKKKFTVEWSFFKQRVADAYATHETLIQAQHTIDPKDIYAKQSQTLSRPRPVADPLPDRLSRGAVDLGAAAAPSLSVAAPPPIMIPDFDPESGPRINSWQG